MKNPFWKILIPGFIVLGVYVYMTSVIRLGEGEFAVSRDAGTGEHIISHPGLNFLWQGAIPGRLTSIRYSRRAAQVLEIKIPIPALVELKNDLYSVAVPVSLVFDIDSRRLSIDPATLGADKNAPGTLLKKALEGYLAREMAVYLEPVYNRAGLLQAGEAIIEKAMDSLASQAGKLGIALVSFEIPGRITVPDDRTYYEGVLYLRDLRELERANKKDLVIFKHALEKERQARRDFLEKLGEVSKLVKGNPDLLKYIYIDRLAGNVKVIITPDKSGMPLGLEFNEKADAGPKKGEIDNLK
jgi:regulator of protease activity HflC (stomatin/prohibitin superfamily)